MATDVETRSPQRRLGRMPFRRTRLALARGLRWVGESMFSSLARRIVVLNLAGLIVLLSGILYLNSFREGLIEERIDRLTQVGQVIAAAIAASTFEDEDRPVKLDLDAILKLETEKAKPDEDNQFFEFPIQPERVAPFLRSYISPTRTRARIYDRDGFLILDSNQVRNRALFRADELPIAPEPPAAPPLKIPDRIAQAFTGLIDALYPQQRLPLYEELGPSNGRGYMEVSASLDGSINPVVRRRGTGELVVSVAVPIQRAKSSTIGVLLLSTQGGDIDAVVRAERLQILRVFLIAAGVTILTSMFMAGTIAGPMHRLAAAADRVRRSIKARAEIPDFSKRQDEIGHLSRALRDMTNALYNRLDAIESFAADVAHELKNPLTSLRSAVETLPLARNDNSRARLMEVIQHDVRRLDRLISDISDASRLDAELAREDAQPVDLAVLVDTVGRWQNDLAEKAGRRVSVAIAAGLAGARAKVLGHDGRLAQVLTNLIDNARSFSPEGGEVRVGLTREGDELLVSVEDDGPGIRPDALERIFERFYTDRPEGEGFGNNSGLGLAISRQIVEAHGGSIAASNRADPNDPDDSLGARFVIRLPAA
ncbi:MAG: stimulus-sensing domain-containing protein [Hyphomicrobiaceae bacterium]|nr:stimulus-sensing domain-containing protein [Hyphomicrobiaceae bacterium]